MRTLAVLALAALVGCNDGPGLNALQQELRSQHIAWRMRGVRNYDMDLYQGSMWGSRTRRIEIRGGVAVRVLDPETGTEVAPDWDMERYTVDSLYVLAHEWAARRTVTIYREFHPLHAYPVSLSFDDSNWADEEFTLIVTNFTVR